jgi:hypothetical protein
MAVSKALATTKKAAPRKTAVAKKPSGTIAQADYTITDLPSVSQIVEALTEGSKLFYDGETSTQGESIRDMFAEESLEKIKDHFGEKLIVTSVDGVRNSEFDDGGGLGVYLIISAVDPEGEVLKMAVGTSDGIGFISRLNEEGELPWAVSFEKATKATRSGYFPVNCVSRQSFDKAGNKTDF